MNLRKFSCSLIACFAFFSINFVVVAQDADAEAGEKLFRSNCASCHYPEKKMIGPALKGAHQRWLEAGDFGDVSGDEWFYRWVRNSTEVVKAGHPYATKLFNDHNKSVMTAFPQLADEDIDNIFAFVDKAAAETTASGPVAGDPSGIVPTARDKNMEYFLYMFLALLVFIVFILSRLTGVLNRMAFEKEGLPVPEAVPFYKDKKILVTVGLVLLIYIGYAAVNGAIDLGRQQGYAPLQPIKYSHELHAGLNSINCQFCHVGAEKGKQALIPSLNICMNCHKGIQGTDPVNGKYGRMEIAKIYASIGFDPNTLSYIKDYEKMDDEEVRTLFMTWLKEDENRQYTQSQIEEVLAFIKRPVEWVRIHNLPDHVYFNHSQHVNVGGLACQSCHGPVETMEVLYQHAPLSMGWCLDCHRTTEVNFTGNGFYKDDYEYLHKMMKAGEIDKVTVANIGGEDCQRCHY